MVKQDNLDIFDIRIIYDISRQADNFIPQTVVRRKTICRVDFKDKRWGAPAPAWAVCLEWLQGRKLTISYQLMTLTARIGII